MDALAPYVPLITIFGPIIGALIGAAVTYYIVAKRKKATFYISNTEELTKGLRQHLAIVVLRLNDRDVLELNRTNVTVLNNGNTSIKDFEFDIVIPGHHKLRLADKSAEATKLHQAIEINWDKNGGEFNHTFTVKVPFFNPKETFDIPIFFDMEPDEIRVECRMEDLRCDIRPASYIDKGEVAGALLNVIAKSIALELPIVRRFIR